ncbi:MAG: translation elongation factor Ts [Actinomycetota bacterium]|nr:translation elongation factor Ts [Actinomycetota bacterium]
MTDVPASMVKELRLMTGAPMMDCKRALQETGGDLDAAARLLREQGIASAAKRAARETTEGKVLARTADRRGTIVAVGCETEPVSKNDEFVAFAEKLLDSVDANGPEATARLEEERAELSGRLGENGGVRGAERFVGGDGEVVAAYVHRPAEKIGVLVRAKADEDLARLVAMHVAASRPRYLSRDDVPAEEVDLERDIYARLPDVESKPEHLRPQIVEGMIAKRFYAENVLVDQPWIHDPSLTVGKALAERGAEVREFVRLSVAE